MISVVVVVVAQASCATTSFPLACGFGWMYKHSCLQPPCTDGADDGLFSLSSSSSMVSQLRTAQARRWRKMLGLDREGEWSYSFFRTYTRLLTMAVCGRQPVSPPITEPARELGIEAIRTGSKTASHRATQDSQAACNTTPPPFHPP